MKRALKTTGYFVAFIISSIIILAFLVDANMFKPRITALAQERGITLNMRGDLHWAFWPSVGLAVHDVSIASSETPNAPIAEVQKASFLIAFIPLMQGNFQVKHILVDGAIINLSIDAQGKGNWEALVKSQETPTANEKPRKNVDGSITSNDLHLSIEKISLHHSEITLVDQRKDQRIHLSDIELDIDDVNTTNEPFDMDFSWKAQISGAAKDSNHVMSIKGKLHNRIALTENFNAIDLTNGDLQVEFDSKSSASIAIKYAVKIDQLDSIPHYKGTISLPSVNARKWLAALGSDLKTANEKAFSDVSLTTEIDGDTKKLSANNVNLQLDKTHLKGSISLTDFATQALNINLQGDDITLDDYLAPKVEATESASNNQNNTDSPLPLSLLRKLNLNLKLTFNKIVFSQIPLEKIQLDVAAHNGNIQQEMSANAYRGSIHEKTKIDVSEKTANIRFEAIAHGIQLEPLLKDKKLDKNLHLSGAIEANANGQANGATTNQLIESLNSNANFAGVKIRLAPINIEQQFCQMVDLINKTDSSQKSWNAYTELRELSGKVNIANRIITVDSVNAGIEKLQLGTTGTINLASGAYDFKLPLKLIRDANDTPTSLTTSAQGCTVNSNYWAERSMALLRCKGTYAEINPAKDCRPDKEMLTAVVKDFAEYKLREKHGAKIEAKKTELLKKLDDKLGGAEKAEQAKALLKNLFKKKDDQEKSEEQPKPDE